MLESFPVPAWGIEARAAWGFARERRVHGVSRHRAALFLSLLATSLGRGRANFFG